MTPLLKNNVQIYFILVNVIIALIYSLSSMLIVMSYRIKNKNYHNLWQISVLKICLPFLSVGFFGQIFLLLTTVLDCQDGKTYVSKEILCRTGIWFSIEAPLTLLAMLLHALLALTTNTLYYKSTFIKYGSDVLKKTNCYPDVMLLFTKIFVIVLFILDDGKEEEHWIVLFFLNLVTGLNSLCNYFYQTRQNQKLNNLNNIFCLMPFFGFLSLFIGKIFKSLGFNGSIFLFFSWCICGALFILFYKKKDLGYAMINYKQIENPGEYLNYIHKFHKIILNKNNSRNDYTILKSLLSKKEEKCFDIRCPIKKYLENISNEIDDIFPLLQFCEKLFDFGISKFPNDIILKINYSMFLIFEMNNNKKALITLNNINANIFSFEDNYNIFRCQRLIDEYIINKNKNKNIVNSYEYKKKVHNFKLLVSKTTTLYYDFWTLIIINKLNVTNNIDDLNKIGSEIIKLNKNIEEEYEALMKIKPDNYDLISFYSNFTENVLNDHEKFKKRKITFSTYNNISDSQEDQFSNFDVNTLKEKDFFKYFILSGNKKNLANIIDYSLNLSNVLGYTKEEIIGKNINVLIPELFHKNHDKELFDFTEKAESTFFKELFINDNYIPDYLEKNHYAITKSKFLIPLKLKIYYVQTEGNEFIYVVEIKKNKDYKKNLEDKKDNDLKCVVLTDNNFYIQTFTSNCLNHLKLDDTYINSNYNIINFIKQLKNEYLKKINELVKVYSLNNNNKKFSQIENSALNRISSDNISFSEKKRIKKELVEEYYLEENEIIWRINLNKKPQIPIHDNIFNHSSLINEKYNYFSLIENKNFYEEEFILEIKKIILAKELVGYYFIFHNMPKEQYNSNNFITFNISHNNQRRRNSVTRKKKYKYLFQIKPTSMRKQQTHNHLFNESSPIKRCKSPKKNKVKYKSYEKMPKLQSKERLLLDKEEKKSNAKNKSAKNINKFKPDIINNDDNKEQISINEEFLPECSFNFAFDFSDKIYKPVFDIKNKNENSLNEILKFQALKKVNTCKEFLNKKKETKNKNYSESYDSEESENESKESSSDKSPSLSYFHNPTLPEDSTKIQPFSSAKVKNKENNNNIPLKESNTENTRNKQTPHKNDFFNDFYKVNFNKIFFSIYDFNKDMVVESTTEKISQIESLLKAKSRLSVDIKFNNEYPNIFINNIVEEKKRENLLMNKKENNEKKDKITNEKIMENKIMEAINKEQDQESIISVHKNSLSLIFILIITACVFLYYELTLCSESMEILSLIKSILSINYCNKFGLYFIRELTLLNVPDTGIKGGKYEVIPAKNKTEYIELVRKYILDLFIESQLAMTDIIESTLPITKNSENLLNQTKLMTKLSNTDSKSTLIENNVIINIIQLNSAFYNLASSTSPVEQNHADLYNFVYNSLNNFGLAIKILIDIYIKEVNIKAGSYDIAFKIQLGIYLAIYIISYIIALFLYSNVIQRKKSYMRVFLNINYDFISLSITKCEQFINRFKLAEENKRKDDEADDSYDEKDSLIKSEKIYKDMGMTLKQKTLKFNNNNKRNKRFKCSKSIIFKIFFGVFLLVAYVFYYLFGFFCTLNVNKLTKNIADFYFHLQQYHLTIVEYFNLYREYIFDNGTIILNKTPYENLVRLEKEIYENWTDDVNNITFFTRTLINNKDIRNQLNKSLCSYYITNYFKSEQHCINAVGNGYNQDINTFAYGFVDEIRIKKNIIRDLLNNDKIIGDLSEYKTETWYKKYYVLLNNEVGKNDTSQIRFRLQLFNEEYLHFISNLYFINVILPCLNENRKIIFENLTIAGKKDIFFFLITILLILFISIYIFYWAPMIKNLNKIIYEIKSILKIIPLHILMADANIKNLLHISFKK